MKIDRAVGRPGGELPAIIVHYSFASDHGHFPAELGATPRPIKIDIGKWKCFLVESVTLLPGFAPNQKWAGENHIARAPANSFAGVPDRIVRSVQIQLPSENLSERERYSHRKTDTHS